MPDETDLPVTPAGASPEEPGAAGATQEAGAAPEQLAVEIEQLKAQIKETERKLQAAKDKEVRKVLRDAERRQDEALRNLQTQWEAWASAQGYEMERQAQAQRVEPEPEEMRELRLYRTAKALARDLEVPMDAFDLEEADTEIDLAKQAAAWVRGQAAKGAQAPAPAARSPADRTGSARAQSAPAPSKAVTEEDVHRAIEAGDLKKAEELYQQLFAESVPVIDQMARAEAVKGRVARK